MCVISSSVLYLIYRVLIWVIWCQVIYFNPQIQLITPFKVQFYLLIKLLLTESMIFAIISVLVISSDFFSISIYSYTVYFLQLLTVSTTTRTKVQWLLKKLCFWMHRLCIIFYFGQNCTYLENLECTKKKGMDYFTLPFLKFFFFSIRKSLLFKMFVGMAVWEWRRGIYKPIGKKAYDGFVLALQRSPAE